MVPCRNSHTCNIQLQAYPSRAAEHPLGSVHDYLLSCKSRRSKMNPTKTKEIDINSWEPRLLRGKIKSMQMMTYFAGRGHTVPMETPQSMLEEPSSGSKTTQYLHIIGRCVNKMNIGAQQQRWGSYILSTQGGLYESGFLILFGHKDTLFQ